MHLFEKNRISLRALRPRQDAAISEIKQAIREGHKRIVVQAPTGFGKTLLSAHIISGSIEKGKRPIFICPAISLVDQTLKSFEVEGIHDIGVIQARHERTDWDAQVQIASIHTLIRRPVPKVDLIIIDECFPAGTMITTPVGPIPIEKMRSGYSVSHGLGTGLVKSVFKKRAKQLVKVRLSNGNCFRCTPDHPVFTVSGWKKAGQLEVRESLFREADVRALRCGLWSEVEQNWGECGTPRIGGAISPKALLRELLREADGESDVSPAGTRICVAGAQTNATQAASPRRERKAYAGDTAASAQHSGRRMGGGTRRQDAPETAALSLSLQTRSGEPCSSDRDRVGWRQPSLNHPTAAGPQEGCPASPLWVESVEIEELGSPEFVYNLRVSGHPSYFANGILVHNCHEQFDGLYKLMDSDAWKDKIVIGLSATPWSKGMGLHWTKLIVAGTTRELIQEGWLCPFVGFGPNVEIDRSKIEKGRDGDFTEESASVAMCDEKIVGDVVKEWMEKGPGEKTFMFCVNRAHAKALRDRFFLCGIECGYIDGETPREERKEEFRKLRDGEIKVIASVGCLIRGVDEDVRCIIDAQPTTSEIRHVQKIGRGLRTAEGKSHLIILDHAGNNENLGMVTDIHHAKLDSRNPGDRTKPFQEDRTPPKPRKCSSCHRLVPKSARKCPHCGFVKPYQNTVEHVDGHLVEFALRPPMETREKPGEDRQAWWSGFLHIAQAREKSRGWASHRFKEKFGHWPNDLFDAPKPPTKAMTDYDKSLRIRYAKSKQKEVKSA